MPRVHLLTNIYGGLILPVQYLYNRGCKLTFSIPQSTLEDRYKAAIGSSQAIRSSQHYLESIYHVADFGEHGNSSFECILLKPLYFEENEPPGY
ncbi:hypothetical protein [Mucilaginibacter terrenus]|uniref:hypothetical protein n=1 Tax=Mucilaginibacter terrenus TaxID=2482727 RepID=UPI0014033606|nr:hypothetical protein [Mucilaginibacter terrenus]